MTYIRRAVKYFVQMAIVLALFIGILMAMGVVDKSIAGAFIYGWKSFWWIIVCLTAVALTYPSWGYQKRKININGDPALAKPGFIEAMKGRGYELTSETDGVLKFRLSSPVNRVSRMWEDTITLSPVLGGWEVEGLTRDVVRVIGSIEYYFRNHGKED